MAKATLMAIFSFWLATLSFLASAWGERQPGPILVSASTVIQKDMEFDGTAFVIKGSNITLDLGGRTITFNNGNAAEAPNREFESWSGGSPAGWSIVAGSAEAVAATYFGNYDLSLSGNGAIRSSPIALKAGKTYLAFAFVRGPESGTARLRVLRAVDLAVLAERTWGGSVLSRGFASSGDPTADLKYKPATDVNVVLELSCSGNSAFRVGMVDIKPAFDYGITTGTYHNTTYHPDLPSTWFSGAANNVTIKNGKLVQGDGRGVRCAGIFYTGSGWTMQNVVIEMNGINTDGISGSYPGPSVIDSCVVKSTSPSVFNRMHASFGIVIEKPGTGAQVITNNVVDGVPEAGIGLMGCINPNDTVSYRVTGNTIRQRELVTEGYAIGASGIKDFEISNNRIEPYQGRGILLDASSGCSSGGKGSLNGSIHDNEILNLNEFRNPEYDYNALECTGIRIRNWGAANQSHKNLKIFNNTISGFTDGQRVHRVYGINLTVSAPEDSVEIYNNDISVTATGQGRSASAVAVQSSDLTKGNSVRIYNNTLASNAAILQFGGNDGESAKGLLFEGNTFRRLTSPAPIGKPFLYGYWVGEEKFNILANSIPETADVDPADVGNIQFDGSGAKSLNLGRHRLEVQVRGANGVPFPEAAVTLKDNSGNILHQDTTGADGKVVMYTPKVFYSGAGTAIQRKDYPDGAAFEITAGVPGGGAPKLVSIAVSSAQLVTIDFEEVVPPPSPLAPSAPKNLRIGN
ncbi:MAG: hypothetical protein WHT06_14330 [Desulfobacterales bacterium]